MLASLFPAHHRNERTWKSMFKPSGQQKENFSHAPESRFPQAAQLACRASPRASVALLASSSKLQQQVPRAASLQLLSHLSLPKFRKIEPQDPPQTYSLISSLEAPPTSLCHGFLTGIGKLLQGPKPLSKTLFRLPSVLEAELLCPAFTMAGHHPYRVM